MSAAGRPEAVSEAIKALEQTVRSATPPGRRVRVWFDRALTLMAYAQDLEARLAGAFAEIEQARAATAPEVARCYESGKVIFGSESEARRAMNRKKGARLRAYQCPSCYGWHLTHRDKR